VGGKVPVTFAYSNPTAKTVHVAGEFNSWLDNDQGHVTGHAEWQLQNDGAGNWKLTTALAPGTYKFKYVVDGGDKWDVDPSKPASADGNSIITVSAAAAAPAATGGAPAAAVGGKVPVTFAYSNPTAKTVHVAGEFNSWLDNDQGHVTGHAEWQLQNDGAGNWKLTTALAPGTYKFKYVVDGGDKWDVDPSKPASADGNSIITVSAAAAAPAATGGAPAAAVGGKVPVTFTYVNPSAKTVHVGGEFNKWLDNDQGHVTGHAEWQMQNDGAGNWTLATALPPGKYKFKYVVDGGDHWDLDPNKPASTDGNSLIEVSATAATPAATGGATAPGAGVTFTYADPNAKAVFLAGEFNNWSATANPMQKDATGIWTASIPLKPGRYQYKFVVDGNWLQDTANPDSANDGAGNVNSVKTVTP
jgi:1,4-alpha-glucan branching enzyme